MRKLFCILIPCLLLSCGVVKWKYPSKDVAGELNTMDVLTRDCPDEMIINNSHTVGAIPTMKTAITFIREKPGSLMSLIRPGYSRIAA